MGISIREYQVAMETFGAKRLSDVEGTRYSYLVPRFEISGAEFIHSGSYYIVNSVPDSIMSKAMAELNEEHPGGKNFWWGEIHSVIGLLTVACMLENKYSKELVEELANKTFMTLLDTKFIKEKSKSCCKTFGYSSINENKVKLMAELLELVDEFDRTVNPYADSNIKIKEPRTFFDKVSIAVTQRQYSGVFNLETNAIALRYAVGGKGVDWTYSMSANNDPPKGGYTEINHYYENYGKRPPREMLYVRYTETDEYEDLPSDINLRIDLKSGNAWNTYQEYMAKPLTQKTLKKIIRHIKSMIKKAKSEIIDNMTE